MSRPAITLLTATAMIGIAAATAPAVVMDFDSNPTQYADNFRALFTGAGATNAQATEGANGLVTLNNSGSAVRVYDTTPASNAVQDTFNVSTGSPLTISADVRFQTALSSIGVYIVDPTNEANGYAALFNVDSAAPNDRFRLSGNATTITSAAGIGTPTVDVGTSDVGVAPGASFYTVTVTYAIDAGNHPILTLAAGTGSQSFTFTTLTAMTSVEVALRLASQAPPNANALYAIDNVTITSSVPEPVGMTAALTLPTLLAIRRR